MSMKQEDVGRIIGVSTDCITLWENNHSKPMIHHMPKIVEFLGYNPIPTDQKGLAGRINSYRIKHGLSYKNMGVLLGVDASTIGAWEKGTPISKKNLDRINRLFITSK